MNSNEFETHFKVLVGAAREFSEKIRRHRADRNFDDPADGDLIRWQQSLDQFVFDEWMKHAPNEWKSALRAAGRFPKPGYGPPANRDELLHWLATWIFDNNGGWRGDPYEYGDDDEDWREARKASTEAVAKLIERGCPIAIAWDAFGAWANGKHDT